MKKLNFAVEILEDAMTGYVKEDRISYLEDVTQHGCISGIVGAVIYYKDTKQYFRENFEDIFQALEDYEDEHGYNLLNALTEKENTSTLYNVLVWFAVEQTASIMLDEARELEEA